ncbi:hypothetical protein JCM9492_10640 [Aquifex pyrophilus]
MSRRKRKKKDVVRTTVTLPREVWEELRIESIKKNITLGDLIAKKLEELKYLKKKLSVVSSD